MREAVDTWVVIDMLWTVAIILVAIASILLAWFRGIAKVRRDRKRYQEMLRDDAKQ